MDTEGAVARGQGQPGKRRPVEVGKEAPVPMLPVALSRDPHRQWCLKACQLRNQTMGGRIEGEAERQPVLFGHGVELEVDAVAALPPLAADDRTLKCDLRAAVGDVGGAVDRGDLPLAGDGRFEDEAIDPQPADVDVVIGQQRRVAPGSDLELRQAGKGDGCRDGAAQVDVVARVGGRAPVELHLGRGQEHALGVGQGQAVDRHPAIERTVDSPDADLHAILELESRNAARDEAAPGIAVEAEEK